MVAVVAGVHTRAGGNAVWKTSAVGSRGKRETEAVGIANVQASARVLNEPSRFSQGCVREGLFVAESWKKGDVFLVPIDSTRVGLGQIVDVLQSELYVVIYADVWNASSPPCPRDVVGREVLFASLTLDAKLHHGDWTVIGDVTDNLANIKLPLSKVRISGEMHIESHDGSWSRCATPEEAEQLKYRKTVAPVRLEKALKAHYGILEPHPAYDDLRYDLVIDLAKLGGG